MVRIDYDISDDSYYLFTCAELKKRETEFLDESRIERLLRSGGTDEFIKTLRDTIYSRYLNDIENSGSFERVILREYGNTVKFLNERLRDEHKPVIGILFLEEHMHNLKVVIKSIILNMDLENLFVPILDSYQTLRNAASTGNYKEIDPLISEVFSFEAGLAEVQKNYRLMELEIEKFYLRKIFDTAKKLKRQFIIDYLRHVVDIYNIKNICRNKYLAEDLNFDNFIYENGFMPKKSLKRFEVEPLDFFVREMEKTDYADMVTKGIRALNSEKTFSSFEKNEDEFYMVFFDPLTFTVSNLEKVFQFFLRKKTELRYLNIIYTGVLYGIDKEKIRNRVKV